MKMEVFSPGLLVYLPKWQDRQIKFGGITNVMKSQILAAFGALLVSLAGCGKHAAILPDNSFRLKVTDVFSSEDERVSTVTVETSTSKRYSVRAKSVHLGDGVSIGKATDTGLYRERVLTFVSSRISPNGSKQDYIRAILKRGEEVTMTDIREFPHGTPMAQMATLTVRDGVYPLSKPLMIGRLNGEDLFLAVGDVQMETAKQ